MPLQGRLGIFYFTKAEDGILYFQIIHSCKSQQAAVYDLIKKRCFP